MNRIEAAACLGVLALVVVGVGQKYLQLSDLADTPDPMKSSKPELTAVDRPVASLESAVNAFLANAESAADADRLVHLGELISAVDGPDLADEDLDAATAETLAKNVVAVVEADSDGSQEGEELRRRAVGLLASRVASPTSKAFILKVLTDGPQDLRDEAVARVGSPRGVRGPSVYAKIRELAAKGLVPDVLLPSALRRTGGLKARGVLTAIMKSTDSAVLVNGCAVALQDYRDPALLGDVLERLEQVGRLDSPGKLPWISASLLEAHMKTADAAQFRRGLAAMAARPGLAKLDELRKGLDSPDAATRRVAAAAVKKAVLAKVVDAATGQTMLAGRLKTETEPVLKAELTESMERVEGLLPETRTSVQ
ncbi:MAG TPA: hypothetical protein VH309_10270 [Elusimicrobiota bacterium]|nr:hypothetical protein [Elusimicrobiota bacterium]